MEKLVKSFGEFITESTNAYDDNMTDEVSDCCGAPIEMGDICSDCGEHCEPQQDEEFDNDMPEGSDEPQEFNQDGSRIDDLLNAIESSNSPAELADKVNQIGKLDISDPDYETRAHEVVSAMDDKGPEFKREFAQLMGSATKINHDHPDMNDDGA